MRTTESTSKVLIQQYFITLETQFRDALANSDFDRAKAEPLIAQLETMFHKRSVDTWDDAYRAEQLLASILPASRLDAAIARRMSQARKMLPANMVATFEQQLKESPNLRRSVLSGLIAELQWSYRTRSLRRACQRNATVCGSWFFIGAFILFVSTLASSMFLVNNIGNLVLYLLVHAVFTGALGASYSTLTSVKAFPEDVPVEKIQTLCSKGYILSRILIGLCASLILVFFFHSEIITSTLVPTLNAENIKAITSGITDKKEVVHFFILNKNFALLTVYCFLAGFSEKFVPNLLNRMEEKADKAGIAGNDATTPKAAGSGG